MDTEILRITESEGNRNLIKELFEKGSGTDIEPHQEFFKDDKDIILVSYTGGSVSGFLWAFVLVRPDRPEPMALLYSIDVFEPFRRNGVATQLIQHLKEILRTHKCCKMFVPTGVTNLPAIGLYRKTGGVADEEGLMFQYDQNALSA